MNNVILETQTMSQYKDIALRMLKYNFPNLSYYELEEAVDYSIMNRYKQHNAVIDNNYKNKKIDTTLLELTEYILKREPIMTAAGVLFKKHTEGPNPIAKLLENFMEGRNAFKKKMFQFPKGSEQYEKFNLLQLLAKIDSNGLQ